MKSRQVRCFFGVETKLLTNKVNRSEVSLVGKEGDPSLPSIEPGIYGAPANGAPDRTFDAVLAAIQPHVRSTISAQRYIFDFASPVQWDAARHSVAMLQDRNHLQWTFNDQAFPPIAEALVIYPKDANSVIHSFGAFPV